jgi:hypothetical protein
MRASKFLIGTFGLAQTAGTRERKRKETKEHPPQSAERR